MHVIRLKQLIQFDLTGFCKTLVAIVWNMVSCNNVTKTAWDCVKAIAACLTSCIFASFGCWASLGKLGQAWARRLSRSGRGFPLLRTNGRAPHLCLHHPLTAWSTGHLWTNKYKYKCKYKHKYKWERAPSVVSPPATHTRRNLPTNTGHEKIDSLIPLDVCSKRSFSLDDSKVDRRSQIHFIASLDLLYSVIPPLTIWWLSVS